MNWMKATSSPHKGKSCYFPEASEENKASDMMICCYCCFIAKTGIISCPRLMISHDSPIGSRVHQEKLIDTNKMSSVFILFDAIGNALAICYKKKHCLSEFLLVQDPTNEIPLRGSNTDMFCPAMLTGYSFDCRLRPWCYQWRWLKCSCHSAEENCEAPSKTWTWKVFHVHVSLRLNPCVHSVKDFWQAALHS